MTIKKIYPALLLSIGFILGYLLFHSSETTTQSSVTTNEHSHLQLWTCSMHPHIEKQQPGKCPICGMTLVKKQQSNPKNKTTLQMSKESVKLANIEISVVKYANTIDKKIKVNGRIVTNETQTASIVSHMPGRIEKMYINYTGELVKKGQKIALIYAPALITAQRELLEAKKLEETNPELLQAAIDKFSYWKIPQRIINEILQTQKTMEYFSIYAAYDGVVAQKKISTGDHVDKGTIIFEIENLKKLWVNFDVYEKDLRYVNEGDEVIFSITALPDKVFKSTITFINPVVNDKERIVKIRGELDNTHGLLRPQMFVTGGITVSQPASTELLIPKTAVLWTGERSVVYVKLPETEIPSYEFREVVISRDNGRYYTVIDGLEQGESVVTQGAFYIDSSAQLNNQNSMMNRMVEVE